MGNQCLSSNVNEHYSKYLQQINLNELKQKWSTIQVYKIKKIFDNYADPLQNLENQTHIPFAKFKDIFPQFIRYQEKQIQRIFQIFDFHHKGYLNWTNFFSSITICYYGSQNILSLLMFMIFDEAIEKKLNKDQLTLMIDLNSNCIRQSGQQYNEALFQAQQIIQLLIKERQYIKINEWLSESSLFIDFQKYRRLFNIFIEEKLQKQLISMFQVWNDLYNQNSDKYVSYVINYKWFQIWQIYVLNYFGTKINVSTKNPNTLKTMKTVKSLKFLKKTMKSIASIKSSKKILIQNSNKKMFKNKNKQGNLECQVKNYDFIHSNIGQKPTKMYNNMLQGEYQQVLAPQLVENMHYMLVSQKVWNKFKHIYNGHPEFRRTGQHAIQLYPKIVKIYSQIFKQKIDFSSQIIRQVSGYLQVKKLLIDSLELDQDNLKSRTVFFKTFGMNRWQELIDLSIMFAQISTQVIIFLAHVHQDDLQSFKKNHCKMAQTLQDINIGDEIKYEDPRNPSIKKVALYMGKNTEGKHLIHFKGQSFIYDLCVDSNVFQKKASLNHKYTTISNTQDPKNYVFQMIGIPDLKGYNLVNTIILNLILNPDFKQTLLHLNSSEPKQILQILAYILKQCKKKSLVDSNIISELIQMYLPDYQNFQLGMLEKFFFDFMKIISNQLQQKKLQNVIDKQFKFKVNKKSICTNCKNKQNYSQEQYLLSLQVPESVQRYYQFTFVPFSNTLKSQPFKKCGMKLKLNSTFKNYKNQVQKIVDNIKNCPGTNFTFVICQIYGNDIIKNYGSVKDEVSLDDICLRDTDQIVVFELCCQFDRFVQDHYTQIKDITSKSFKVGSLIDSLTENNKWNFGKIIDIQHMLYTHKTLLTIQYKISKELQQKTYEVQHNNISVFPTKSYLYSSQYHLKVLQRFFNESLNEMQICNMPLVITLSNWMRCRQFQFFIYQQLKIFIAQSYQFKDNHESDFQNELIQNNVHLHSMYIKTKKYKVNRFKQYMHSQQFPYRITLIDRDGRCVICHKYQKTIIYKGESQFYCQGCKINQNDPISWQVKVKHCVVCIDWKNSSCFKKDIAKDHSSFTNMIMNKKNDVQNLQKLICNKFSKRKQQVQMLCCNFPYTTIFYQQLKSSPNILNIQIQRLVIDGNRKKINDKYVSFPFTQLKVSYFFYDLISVVAIQKRQSIIYKTYFLGPNQEWYQFHAEKVKRVKKNTVQKCCALILTYQKTSTQKQLAQCFEVSDQNQEQSQQKFERNRGRNKTKNLTIAKRLQDQSFQSEQADSIQKQTLNDSISEVSPRSSQKKSGKIIKTTTQHLNRIHSVKRQNKLSKCQTQNRQKTILFSENSIKKSNSQSQCVYKSNKSTKIRRLDSKQLSNTTFRELSNDQSDIMVKTNRLVDFKVDIQEIQSIKEQEEDDIPFKTNTHQKQLMCLQQKPQKQINLTQRSKSQQKNKLKINSSIKFAKINNEDDLLSDPSKQGEPDLKSKSKLKSRPKVNFNFKQKDQEILNNSLKDLQKISLDSDDQYI